VRKICGQNSDRLASLWHWSSRFCRADEVATADTCFRKVVVTMKLYVLFLGLVCLKLSSRKLWTPSQYAHLWHHLFIIIIINNNNCHFSFSDQWRRNYLDKGVHCNPPSSGLYPLYPQVKDAAYVKILSKRLKLQDCIRFVQICTPPLTKTFRRACFWLAILYHTEIQLSAQSSLWLLMQNTMQY